MNLRTPDFSNILNQRYIAGLRPYREGSFRLEFEKINNKIVIHNYGHGGAGITMSWGCAEEVLNILVELDFDSSNSTVAILGAGVMGLSVATILSQKSFDVKIYTKDRIPNTTSNIAGGQWAPSIISYKKDYDSLNQFNRILRSSFNYFSSKIGADYGVSRQLNFTPKKSTSFEKVPKDIIPEPTYYKKLPFDNINSGGYSYNTLLIEPPIYLSKLEKELLKNNVKIENKELKVLNDVLSLDEMLVINCTGLGARELFKDKTLKPLKGNLVLLEPQNNLDYLYSGGGYLFPRKDSIVIGGSVEESFDKIPDQVECQEILKKMIKTFGVTEDSLEAILADLPNWYYKDFV